MPMFMAVHKWKPQDEIAIMKELVGAFAAIQAGKLEGMKLLATYSLPQGAYCVWEAASKEVLEKGFEKNTPVLKKNTEFVPVAQSYPPTMDYVLGLWQMWVKSASK